MNDWLKALLIAIILLLLLHVLVVRWVTVQSTSMYATLLPGDLLLVQRIAKWTGFERNDIVVFRDPINDRSPMLERTLLVKRIVGMPGDKVQIRDGDVFVNGAYIPPPERGTSSFVVRVPADVHSNEIADRLQLPENMLETKNDRVELPLNEELAQQLQQEFPSVEVREMSSSIGNPRNIFPFSPQFRWNNDDHGPIEVPAQGDTIEITLHNLPLYDRIISQYESHTLSVSGDTLLIDGSALMEYVIEEHYYFMLGDSRDHSNDSRYWGFVPEDHLVGKVAYIIASKGVNGLRTDRTFMEP